MFRIPAADLIAAVALAAMVAGVIAFTGRELTSDSFIVSIGDPGTAVRAPLPAPTVSATVTGLQTTPRYGHRLTLTSPIAGRFTVTGGAFYELGAIRNTQLWVNGWPVAFSVFEGEAVTGDSRSSLRPVAKNVQLRSGDNDLLLRIARTDTSVVLRFQRQGPSRWAWPAGAGLAAFALLGAVSKIATRFCTGFRRPAAVAAGTLALVGGVLGWIGIERGADFVGAGDSAPDVEGSVRELDAELARPQTGRGAGTKRVFVFGDSTQQFPNFEFKEALGTALGRDHPGRYSVYGMAHGGMTGRDYFLLLSKVLKHRPDVLVLPINIPTFEDRWYNNRMWHFNSLERFLLAAELPRALGLRVGSRRFRWEQVMLRKADAAWFSRVPSRFLGGLRVYVDGETRRMGAIVQHGLGISDLAAYRPEAPDRFVRIARDSDMVEVFRAINALANKHGIRIVYYTTPLDDEGQKSKGIFFQPRFNFDTIQRELAGPSHVTFLRLDESFPKELFRDDFVHLEIAGIEYLADRVAQTVETLAVDASTPP